MLPIETITEEALALPSDLRVQLIKTLVESLDFDLDERVRSAWLVEAKQRKDAISKGTVRLVPGDEALARVRQILES